MAVSHSYDIILMDCEMPNKNGFDATREILDRTPRSEMPAVIALTPHAMEGYEQKCLAAGMKGYLTKPLDKELFFTTLKQFAPTAVAGSSERS